MWVPNTGQGGYTYFNRYYFAQQDKQGAIIDERFNGGGSAANYMVDIMSASFTATSTIRSASARCSRPRLQGFGDRR